LGRWSTSERLAAQSCFVQYSADAAANRQYVSNTGVGSSRLPQIIICGAGLLVGSMNLRIGAMLPELVVQHRRTG